MAIVTYQLPVMHGIVECILFHLYFVSAVSVSISLLPVSFRSSFCPSLPASLCVLVRSAHLSDCLPLASAARKRHNYRNGGSRAAAGSIKAHGRHMLAQTDGLKARRPVCFSCWSSSARPGPARWPRAPGRAVTPSLGTE